MQTDRMASASCRPASMRTAIFPLKHLGVRPHTLRGRRCSATAGKPLSFHIGETTMSFPLSAEQAGKLSDSVKSLLETFAAKQKAERPRRWDMMEYRLRGEEATSVGLQMLEVMCNPNAYSTAFDAKVLITLSTTAGVKITTEGRLSNLKQDVDAFLENV